MPRRLAFFDWTPRSAYAQPVWNIFLKTCLVWSIFIASGTILSYFATNIFGAFFEAGCELGVFFKRPWVNIMAEREKQAIPIGLHAAIEQLDLKLPRPIVRSELASGARKTKITHNEILEQYPRFLTTRCISDSVVIPSRIPADSDSREAKSPCRRV
jgi:hypothetical protein